MANLKDIRTRIGSVNSTMQITSAMKMVSAAKLKRAQDAITQMRPYASKLKEILVNLSTSLESSEGVYSQQREVKNVLLVAITSNRGLCGAFNANIIKQVNIEAEKFPNAKVSVITIGKKATDFYTKPDSVVSHISSHDDIFADLTFANVATVAEGIMADFVNGKYDKVEVVYNQFKNAATQEVVSEDFLPVVAEQNDDTPVDNNTDYIFVPSKEEIVEALIPKSLKTQLYKGVLDSHASEHGARMTAMHKATDNANDLLNDLRLTYNKARQAAITNEILEIVAGAEALNG
jgi:F-type H+-transporting ATPase subunit gamma